MLNWSVIVHNHDGKDNTVYLEHCHYAYSTAIGPTFVVTAFKGTTSARCYCKLVLCSLSCTRSINLTIQMCFSERHTDNMTVICLRISTLPFSRDSLIGGPEMTGGQSNRWTREDSSVRLYTLQSEEPCSYNCYIHINNYAIIFVVCQFI